MVHSRAIAMGLVLALTSGSAFIVPGPASCRPASSPGSAAKSVTSPPSQARPSHVSTTQLSGISIPGITDLVTGLSDTTLPQNDSPANQVARRLELTVKQGIYQWNYTGIPEGVPWLDGMPLVEIPTAPWIAKTAASIVKILLGLFRSSATNSSTIEEALADPSQALAFAGTVNQIITDTFDNERPEDISDYDDLHSFPIKNPDPMYDWEDDEVFARLRLQGVNCVTIEKCTEAHRAKLKILDTDKNYEELKTKVDSLLAAGKLFVVDHEMLDGMETNLLDDKYQRYLATGIALFEVVDDDLLPLRPLGIQLSQGHEATPIFTPDDPEYTWKTAKACFEAADFIIHEVVSHLGFTHVVLEGVMVSVNRKFPAAHPIHKLMKPHLEGTAFINYGAQNSLIVSGGAVDRLQANYVEDSWDMVTKQVVERISGDFSPPVDLAARGMTTEDFPGRYMYRDFGAKYWEAIYTWVEEYLKIYYTSEADVEGDYELEGWVNEMIDAALFTWLGEFSGSSDKLGLITKVLATLIYSASVQHAAVNFPQMTSISYVPSCPGSMYAPLPTDKSKETTFEEFLEYLPGMQIAAVQVGITTLLGSVFHTQLGEYGADHFTDTRVLEPWETFQQALTAVGEELEETNAYLINGWRERGVDKRKAANFAYFTLLPDKIPQSINI